MRYPGGKGRSFHSVINLMPPHDTYIETHLGGGAVVRNKRPSQRTVACDVDRDVLRRFQVLDLPGVELVHGDAVELLVSFPFHGGELVYCDPPFWPDARRRERCYRYDYSPAEHERLLGVLTRLPCMVMLSGYRNTLYDAVLASWHRTDLSLPTQIGLVEESVWCNFEPGQVLHDYSFVGADFRQREALRRRRDTSVRRLAEADPLEVNATLADLADAFPQQFLAAAARVA